ncbi:MAG: DNA-3-methyladenine glycosylase I [Flammeovirgaceae bacterium]
MSKSTDHKCRCGWVKLTNPTYVKYHDEEWGVPIYDDATLFEFIVLESAQAGLSWETILNRREGYRAAFDQFDYQKIAAYDEAKQAALAQDQRIIRNKLKIKATVTNAQAFIKIQEEFGSFSKYIWGFVGGKPIVNAFKDISEVPASTPLSDKISKDMKKRGFKFFGTTICYAHMQATGMVNDHTIACFRYQEILKNIN